MRPRREAADSATSGIDVKNAWSCTFILFRFSWRSAKLSADALLPYGPGYLSRYSDSLWAGRSGDRMPVGACFSLHVQTDPGAHPASCTMGTGSCPGVKRPGRGVDHPPHIAPRLKKESS
jgi:hypothetical protein